LAVLSSENAVPPELAKSIEYLDREFEKRLIERFSIPFDVWNSPLKQEIGPLDFSVGAMN